MSSSWSLIIATSVTTIFPFMVLPRHDLLSYALNAFIFPCIFSVMLQIVETTLATLRGRGFMWELDAHRKAGKEDCNLKERRGCSLWAGRMTRRQHLGTGSLGLLPSLPECGGWESKPRPGLSCSYQEHALWTVFQWSEKLLTKHHSTQEASNGAWWLTTS